MKTRSHSQSGGVLPMTLVIIGLVALLLAAYVSLVGSQNSFVHRSFAWASEVPIAEAGIEEAMAHLNSTGSSNRAANGWTLVNGQYTKQRTLGDGYFYSCISTASPPVVTSTGYARIYPQNNYSSRAFRVGTTNSNWPYAILTKGQIKMSGGWIDSFNSSDPLSSTNGAYIASKALDKAKVGSLGTGKVYGDVATGPGGTVSVGSSGAVGDKAYVTNGANGGTVQSGHSRNDLSVYIADVAVPYTNGYYTPSAGTINGTNYTYVIDAGDWLLSSLSLSGSQAAIVTGKARLYVTGNVALSGSSYILLDSGASLQLYVGGSTAAISGGGVVNSSSQAANFGLLGLPTCTKIDYSGSSVFIGTINAPQADLTLSGSAGLSGALIAKTLTMSGGSSIHYDAALSSSGNGATYVIISWSEL